MNVWKTINSEPELTDVPEGSGACMPDVQPDVRCIVALEGESSERTTGFSVSVITGGSNAEHRSVMRGGSRPYPHAFGFQDFSDGTWSNVAAQIKSGVFQIVIRYRSSTHLMLLRGQCPIESDSIILRYFRCTAASRSPGGLEEFIQYMSSALAEKDLREAFPR